ncbi:hypothetical protein EVAR_25881_1 [Eumeta japonica]|uniref:Uncharacterized protein n=1 Tax=Eumeta variegata TaxID=151549 RepID=A0A4C1W0V8_EUMVA|nr:hypothetical protein EVAR_25881_1 [Eumeta japonica]
MQNIDPCDLSYKVSASTDDTWRPQSSIGVQELAGLKPHRLQLSRASFGFELLLAMKHHARRLFITGLQNSSTVVSISDEFHDRHSFAAVNNKNIDAVRRMIETDRNVTYREV